MKFRTLFTAVSLTSLSITATTQAAVGLIDNFNADTSANYTTYKVLDQGTGATNVSLVIAGGTASNTSSGTSGAEQSLHLFNTTTTLGIGESLVGMVSSITGSGNDFGITISFAPTTSLANNAAGDVRNTVDHLFISFRSPTQLNSVGFVGGSGLTQAQAFDVSVDSLFIERISANEFALGWFDGDTRNVVATRAVANGAAFTRVGFYSDLRADNIGYNGFDSLSIIPEPSSALLGGLGMLAMLRRRRA